jgi:hypothetical protein
MILMILMKKEKEMLDFEFFLISGETDVTWPTDFSLTTSRHKKKNLKSFTGPPCTPGWFFEEQGPHSFYLRIEGSIYTV